MAEAEKKKEEAKKVITRIGKQLAASKTCPNKDTLVKLLKQATSAFPELKQSESLKLAVKPLSDSLVRHGLLQHKDKDVRLLVGICICEIIRVLAPNPDFSDTVFRDIFRLLLSIFEELDDIASPYFSRRAKLLETVAKLQFCVLMLDTGCEDLVLKMFKSFFSVVRFVFPPFSFIFFSPPQPFLAVLFHHPFFLTLRCLQTEDGVLHCFGMAFPWEDHPQSLINSLSTIIRNILEEKVKEADSDPLNFERNTSQPLLDVILQNIIKERKGVASTSFRLAVSVIQNCGEKLERYICQFLTSCILNRDAVGSVIKELYHEIILEIFQVAPQTLLSVIPNLTHELLTDQVDVRIKALNLIRKLLTLPGQHVAHEYPHVFIELLNRFSDKSAEVRLTALSCAKALYMTNPSARESLEVLSAIQGRLLDHDDKVRTEAVNVVCELAKTNLNFESSNLISHAADRLRDKKVLVRSKALKKLVELYQEYCTRCAAGIALLNEHIEEIPCRILMLCYETDCQEFRPQSMELVLAELFPAFLSIEERTRHWIFMFSLFKPPHLKALKIILSQKRRLQDGLKDYLELCNRSEENDSGEAERKMGAVIVKMASCFPDPTKAKDCFKKLKELKDNGILCVLQQLLRGETTLDSETTKDVYLRELGDQNALSEFFHLLCAKCSFNIFSSKYVRYILDCLSSDESEEKHLKNYQVQFFLTIIGVFPSLLRGSEKQFQLLLLEEKIPFNEQLIQMLAREGYSMSIKLSDIYSSLEKVCLEGTRVQSKLAVSAISQLADGSEQFIFSKLCKMLLESLRNGQNLPTVLQSLGCMAQHSVSTFEAQEKAITCYIVEEIFQKNDALASKDLDFYDETSKCCSSCELKVFGLKALARSFLPHKHTRLGRPISFLLGIIQQVLQNGGFSDGNTPCERDEAFIKLAAAKAVLLLSRKWDLHISPQIFRLTILTAKDQSPEIRRSFASKLKKLLSNRAVPSRYACAFSFVALDSLSDLRNDALRYLEEYIREYGKGAQIQEITTAQGAANHPVYLVVFLIHVLAHDAEFPSPDCPDARVYAQFLSPLFVTVQALVNERLVNGDLCFISNASSYLRSIFNAIKKAEDAVDSQMTPKLHLLAEVGISILNSLNTNNTPVLHTPGLILLPSSLYKSGPSEMREASSCADILLHANVYPLIGCKDDTSFTKKLISCLKMEVSGIGNSGTKHDQEFHENSLRPSGSRRGKSGSKSGLLISKTKEQSNELHTEQNEQCETANQEVDITGRQNQIISSNLGLVGSRKHEKEPHRNLGAEISLPCDSAKTKPLLSQNKVIVSCSREEDALTKCSNVAAEQSKSSRVIEDKVHRFNSEESIIKNKGEALVGKHIKLWSPIAKCYYSGLVGSFDSTKSTHQVTYDTGVVDILSLDSEKWEIDLDDLQSRHWIFNMEYCSDHSNDSSASGQTKTVNEFVYDSKHEIPKNRDLSSRKVPKAVKRSKRRKDAIDTSTSEAIDTDVNAKEKEKEKGKIAPRSDPSMATLKTDSPLSQRIARSFLQFLNSEEWIDDDLDEELHREKEQVFQQGGHQINNVRALVRKDLHHNLEFKRQSRAHRDDDQWSYTLKRVMSDCDQVLLFTSRTPETYPEKGGQGGPVDRAIPIDVMPHHNCGFHQKIPHSEMEEEGNEE
ncbi:hypothetical protein BUALT_Bualt08G0120300 [Buddleja alternifolia]|uniref:Sister chromatid cohesion protein PDS5 homolog A n=1 Tax=Buddleja alternifolia TaxID=168488 RepID=A0AAV6XE01_9LAMI|nr:hypothetical protein BUALT_Bualt08G0120300 [Buddleja alternifolia]